MPTFKKLAAFLAVYVIWGSTYLAIRFGVETFPPVLLTTLRFTSAGLLMLVLSWFLREPKLSKRELKIAVMSGVSMVSANALVCIAEQSLPSGLVAVVIGAIPIWIMLASWGFFGGLRPTTMKLFGACLGIAGVATISLDAKGLSGQAVTAGPVLLVIASCLLWTFGSLIQKSFKVEQSPFRFSALQMSLGGLFVGLWSLARGELTAFSFASVSHESYAALAYLIVFGSLIAFSSYNYLSRTADPHIVSTYALVNPVIAVALGTAVYGEPLNSRFVLASALIVGGLAILLRPRLSP